LARSSAPKITPKITDVFDAIAKVGAVLPHAVECKIPDRARFALKAVSVRRYANLTEGPFVKGHIFEWRKDAIFILCSDGHGLLLAITSRSARMLKESKFWIEHLAGGS